jgi:hypothetical protein
MSRFASLPLEAASDIVRPLLEGVLALGGGGRLLNLHTEMANSPAVLASYLGLRQAVSGHGALDRKTGAAIMLAVGQVDLSEYALAVSTQVALRAGWSGDETIALRSGQTTHPKLAKLLAVVQEAAASAGRVDDMTWQAAQAAGWSDAQLVDAFAYVGLALYVDYFTNYASTPLDVPAAPSLNGR